MMDLGFNCCDCRKTDRQMRINENTPVNVGATESVGVGIVLKPSFHSDTFLALIVHSLVPGSSAEQSKSPGDILYSIDDDDVYRRPANEVAKKLLGRPGTTVRLGLLRLVSNQTLADNGDLKPFPMSLATSEGTYEHAYANLERKRIPQQSPRSSVSSSPYTTPRMLGSTSAYTTPRGLANNLSAPTPSPF